MPSARLNFTHDVRAHISLELVSGNAEGQRYQRLYSFFNCVGKINHRLSKISILHKEDEQTSLKKSHPQ
jgi:hypothetical protein